MGSSHSGTEKYREAKGVHILPSLGVNRFKHIPNLFTNISGPFYGPYVHGNYLHSLGKECVEVEESLHIPLRGLDE